MIAACPATLHPQCNDNIQRAALGTRLFVW